MKYIKKPVEIEAVQFTRNNWDEIRLFTNNTAHTLSIEKRINGIATCIIPTLEGHHIANEKDWIIKGVKGEFYPCKPDIFEMTYEPVIQGDKMTNNKQQTEEEKLNRIKMIIELKANKTFLSILADFRLYKVHCMTIYDNQIEDEFELASYWLNVELNKQLNETYGGGEQ